MCGNTDTTQLKRSQTIYHNYFYAAETDHEYNGHRNECVSTCEEVGVACSSMVTGSKCKLFHLSPSMSYARTDFKDGVDTGFIRLCFPGKLDCIQCNLYLKTCYCHILII